VEFLGRGQGRLLAAVDRVPEVDDHLVVGLLRRRGVLGRPVGQLLDGRGRGRLRGAWHRHLLGQHLAVPQRLRLEVLERDAPASQDEVVIQHPAEQGGGGRSRLLATWLVASQLAAQAAGAIFGAIHDSARLVWLWFHFRYTRGEIPLFGIT